MKIFLSLLLLSSILFAEKISIFKVEGMHCPLCTTAVKKAIRKLDGVQKASARLNNKEVKVIYDETKVSINDILKAIKTTSYEGIEISTNNHTK
jgi:mercuric ion binding protein